MLCNHDIIYFSNDWHADNRTSSHHIAKQLCRFNRMLYVEASGLRVPRADPHDIKRIIRKIINFIRGARKVDSQVYVFSPFLLPFYAYSFVKLINKFILIYSLKKECKKLGFKNPILWILIPHISVVVGNLNEKLVVYYCVDDFSSLPGVKSEAIAQLDKELSKKADIIFTPSLPLYEKKKQINENTFLSPHGVDFAHFSKAVYNHLPVPEDIKAIKKPLIGFFGLIENWIDLDLVKYIAKTKPEWSIVMIGRIVKDISNFKGMPNVHFLGARPYKLLPNYAKVFDVAIIPYILNAQVYNANPIKLREYLAAGKPVVTVRSPEIEKFSDVVKISDTYDEFVCKIEIALRENSEEKIKQRIEKVKDSSWENHFEKVSNIVSSYLTKKSYINVD